MATRVFVSYSHDSPRHMERVLRLANRLRRHGVDCVIDQYEQSPAGGWPRWTMNQIEQADYVLVVCTETYDRRFRGDEPRGVGRGAKWEGAIVSQEIYDAEARSTKFVPVLVHAQDVDHVPIPLRGAQHYRPFDKAGYQELYRLLTDQPRVLKPELGEVQSMPALEPVADFLQSGGHPVAVPARPDAPPQPPPVAAAPRRPVPHAAAAGASVVAAGLVGLLVWYLLPSKTVVEARPYAFEYRYFKDLPYALFHTMRGKDFLYWLRLRVTNNTEERLFVDVSCEVLPEPSGRKWAKCADRVASYAVEPGETDERPLEPHLEPIVSDSFAEVRSLSLHWRVYSGSPPQAAEALGGEAVPVFGEPLDQDTVVISIHPKDRFFAQLANDHGDEVDPEFLLASLTGWTKIDPGTDRGRALARASASPRDFVERVYKELLQGPEGLRITAGVPPFPPASYEEIRPARIVWGERLANPLEAALLVGALGGRDLQRLGSGLVLVWPAPAAGPRTLFLAWRAGTAWQAVDLAATSQPLEDNERTASAAVSELLTADVRAQLDSSGVYLDAGRLAAVDFTRAAREHMIEGIP